MKRKLLMLCIIVIFGVMGISCTGVSDLRNSKRHSTKKMTPREKAYLSCEYRNDVKNIPDCMRGKNNYSIKNRLPQHIVVGRDGCPVDADTDGVPDYRDICPETAPCVAVDENGCAVDSDEDGIGDSFDYCPGTVKGVIVNEKGCPES